MQSYGWQQFVSNGTMAGTSGLGKRLEAIEIKLTGNAAKAYDVYYRVHCQQFGWLGWAKNGESAGSAGYGYRLEAIQIQLVKKGGSAPGDTSNVFKDKNHVHSYDTVDSLRPTCTTAGYRVKVCQTCGERVREEIAPVGHCLCDKPFERVEPTCSTDGYEKYACQFCKEITTKTIPSTGKHNYVESGRDAQYIYYTCKGCGGTKTEYNEQVYTVDMGNGQTDTVTGYYDKEMAAEIFNMLNEYRAEKGLDQLQAGSDALQNAVDIRGYEIAKEFSHTRPNGERALLSFTGSTGCCAENIAKYQSSAEEVMNAWKNSSGHNANMLSPNVKKVSISVFVKCQTTSSGKKAYTYHFVQLFGW